MSTGMSLPGETRYRDEVLHLFASGPLMVAAWWDAPTRSQLPELAEAHDEQRRRYGDGAAIANLVVASSPRLPSELRECAGALAQLPEQGGAAMAHVVLFGGLPGMAVRAFFSAMVMLGRSRVPTRVFADRQEAAAWLAAMLRHRDGTWTPARVERAFEAALAGRTHLSMKKMTTPVADT